MTETCEGDSFNYSYDGAGNLTALSRWDEDVEQVETVQYLYNGANQIRCVDADLSGACDGSETVWQYDATGNLLDDGTQTYSYDAALRLASVSDGTSTTTYSYNGDGDRVGQTVDGLITRYVLDIATPLTMVLAETTGTETIATLHGLDLVAQSDGTTTEYFAYDGLGSVRQVADNMGEVLLTQTYDPYGNLYARAGANMTNYGFTGEQEDSSGLLYLRARYYAPGMGRFFQLDPSRQEMNPYQYAMGNPVLYIDPSGLTIGPTDRCRLDPVGCWIEKFLTGEARSIDELSAFERSTLLASGLPMPLAGVASISNQAISNGAKIAALLFAAIAGTCAANEVLEEDLDVGSLTLDEYFESLRNEGVNVNPDPHPLNDPERRPDPGYDPAPPLSIVYPVVKTTRWQN